MKSWGNETNIKVGHKKFVIVIRKTETLMILKNNTSIADKKIY